jgi:hypothetical protein
MTMTRRRLITGLVSFAVTAPAIVRASSLMPVKATVTEITLEWGVYEGVRFLPEGGIYQTWHDGERFHYRYIPPEEYHIPIGELCR